MSPLLGVIGLKTQFPTEHGILTAVNNVSFSLGRGEVIGIVGESGSGKSMTARSILRIVPPPGKIVDGQVLLNGENLLFLTENQMTRVRGGKIAMIFQEPGAALDPVFTVGDQIVEVLAIHCGVKGKEAQRLAEDHLSKVGIPEPHLRFGAFPHELSGGMQQRVTVAIALACAPQVLIADEPTTALDVTIQAQILDLLVRLANEIGVGLIFITHNIAAVAQIAQRILVMYAGMIMEEGATEQVIDSPQHPYTQALLQAMPTMTTAKGQRLLEIKGQVPNLANLPSGCPFHPRCPSAVDECSTRVPPRIVADEGRCVQCLLYRK